MYVLYYQTNKVRIKEVQYLKYSMIKITIYITMDKMTIQIHLVRQRKDVGIYYAWY